MAIPVIGLYNGASPPSGAYLCNGVTNVLGATPDLRNKFIMCAGSSYGLGAVGGADSKSIVAHTHVYSNHTHGSSGMVVDGNSGSGFNCVGNALYYVILASQGHGHSTSGGGPGFTTGVSGASTDAAALDNRPPYYGLTFVMFDGEGLPAGAIVYCYGSIPAGFALCNGGSGTPNLMDRIVISAGSSYGLGATGGEATNNLAAHTHATDSSKYHTHNFQGTTGAATGTTSTPSTGPGTPFAGTAAPVSHTHSISGTSSQAYPSLTSGGASSMNNLPQYTALYPIMKL